MASSKVARGKALMAKLRADPKVKDAEALGAWISRHKRYKKMGLSGAVAKDLAGKLGGSEVAKALRTVESPAPSRSRRAEQGRRIVAPKRDIGDPFGEDYGEGEKKTRAQARAERYEARLVRQREKAERSRFHSIIHEFGGIRSHRDSNLKEEYQQIPNTFKRRDGMTGDDLAEHLARYYPEFGIENERDLIEYFTAA